MHDQREISLSRWNFARYQEGSDTALLQNLKQRGELFEALQKLRREQQKLREAQAKLSGEQGVIVESWSAHTADTKFVGHESKERAQSLQK